MNEAALSKTQRQSSLKNAWRRNKCRYLMLLPAIIATVIFSYLPFVGISIAFMDFDIIEGFANSPWVGFGNFKEIFSDPDIWAVILRTLKYSVVLLFISFPFPIILALMFNELGSAGFKRVAQTLTYLPHFLSWITVVGIFYSALSINGSVNSVLSALLGEAYEKKNILLDSKYFLGVIFTANLWKSLGWSSIIYMSAIAGVDASLYEAAKVDGCGRLRQVWHVTLPGIATTVVIIFVMNFGNVVNVGFELVNGFQNIYTQNETDVISTWIYRNGIVSGNYSHSTAFGISQGLVSVTLVYLANKLSQKLFSVGIW